MAKRSTIKRTCNWLVVLVVFGLLQLWYTVGTAFLNDRDPHLAQQVMDGILLFFCASTLVSCAFDMWISNPRMDSGFIFSHILFPMMMLMGICMVYGASRDSGGVPEDSHTTYMWANYGMVCSTMYYAFTTRLVVWKNLSDEQ